MTDSSNARARLLPRHTPDGASHEDAVSASTDAHIGAAGPAAPPRFVHRYLASVLALASHRISAEFHVKVKKAGLSVTEWRVLASLYESEGETVGELAHLAITKQPTLSKVLPRLEAQGLISSRTARKDRRQTLVRLTPKGNRLVAPLCEAAFAHQKEVLSRLEPDLADKLIGMLNSLIH